jgi:hypothetical protein
VVGAEDGLKGVFRKLFDGLTAHPLRTNTGTKVNAASVAINRLTARLADALRTETNPTGADKPPYQGRPAAPATPPGGQDVEGTPLAAAPPADGAEDLAPSGAREGLEETLKETARQLQQQVATPESPRPFSGRPEREVRLAPVQEAGEEETDSGTKEPTGVGGQRVHSSDWLWMLAAALAAAPRRSRRPGTG